MIDASRGYTFIFKQLNAYKLGIPIGYQLRKENRLGLTDSLSTSNGKTRNEARHEQRFFAQTRVSLLFTQQDAETNGKILESAWLQLQQPTRT